MGELSKWICRSGCRRRDGPFHAQSPQRTPVFEDRCSRQTYGYRAGEAGKLL